MKNIKDNVKGITLITLVVTIVILLILSSIATFSGIEVIKSSNFTKFTAEMKIMQTYVNEWYEKNKNGDNEILNLGEEISTVKEQADIVFSLETSGITEQTGYRYFDKETIDSLNIEGVEREFFINIEKRSVVSYKGFKYNGTTYYTLEQLPSGLYNVEYNENTNSDLPNFDVKIEEVGNEKWRITVSDVQYNGYINKWEVKYKIEEETEWNTSQDLSFIIEQGGKYLIKLVNGDIESKEEEILAYRLIGESDLTIAVGKEKQLDIKLEPKIEKEEFKYEISDTNIATIDQTGKITGISEGKVTITVTEEVTNTTKTFMATVIYSEDDSENEEDIEIQISAKYGWKVTDYTVTTTDCPSGVWRLFYQDSNYTYIINDELTATKYKPEEHYSSYKNGASVSEEGKRLNSKISSLFTTSNTKENIRFTAWITDPNVWSEYANEDAEFAIGSPTVELFAASYNETGKSNKIEINKGTYGYQNNVDRDSLKTSYNKGIYNKNGKDKWWLASPYNSSSRGVCMDGDEGYFNAYSVDSDYAVRPIVCILTSVFNRDYLDSVVDE